MILDGKKIKNQILDELKEEVETLIVKPKLDALNKFYKLKGENKI